ncbi:hypothetical protein OPV22_020317 [Ensete ventricosum]|uniref:Uncharacterized protein n=1 Tax=Ensete ventricosum TaxID=4639 RepID=A0AAV8QMS2_ENSVE|nr:hypothetical protein OPV22_020317 [Ensete ventricosum]
MLVLHAADDADLRLVLALALPALSFQSLDGDFSTMFELPFVQQSAHTLAEEEISVGEPICCTRQFFVCLIQLEPIKSGRTLGRWVGP